MNSNPLPPIGHALPELFVDRAAKHISGILSLAIGHTDNAAAMIVSDAQCPLARTLTAAWRQCLPGAAFIDFDAVDPASILKAFESLAPADLVVLIQSSSFRLGAFRIRIELFQRLLKVIEHPHLARMEGEEQASYYIDSLAYDAPYFRKVGRALQARIDQASCGTVDSDGEILTFASPFEAAKVNIGDYSGMKNIGGQFPIGEVFTEAKDLEAVNGRVRIFAFADTTFSVNKPEKPITLIIERGRITATLDSTPEFDKVLANIRADEGEVWVRELGFGLNQAFSPDRRVNDIGTYERMCGIHLSLGMKHAVYNKPAFRPRKTRHHVDVFAVTKTVKLDDQMVFQDGAWRCD